MCQTWSSPAWTRELENDGLGGQWPQDPQQVHQLIAFINLFLCVWVFCVHACVQHVYAVPVKSEEGTGFPWDYY